MSEHEVEDLYRTLLHCWNEQNASGYAALFVERGTIIGFDGSCMESQASIRDHLESIFADHHPASYVALVKSVQPVGDGVSLLRAEAGMVPPGSDTIKSDVNAHQTMLAVHTDVGWKILLFQNTPAKFDGRPTAVAEMTRTLQAAYDEIGGSR